jgi:predicted N-acyltransferase
MAESDDAVTLRVVDRIADLRDDDWDACAGRDNPFVSHAFLKALEDSGCIGGRTGWRAHHVIAEDAHAHVVACVPCYLKTHSYGEYVFDHGWAEAYARAGGRYYPKLLVAVPFTPVPGPRLLLRNERHGLRELLARGLVEIAKRLGVSSLHANFCDARDIAAFRTAGLLIRTGFQYHWRNESYATFDDFLAALSHSKRKAIRKERREVAAQGVTLEIVGGDALRSSHWDAFFARLDAALRDRVALVIARHDGQMVAGALNLVGSDTLYGRNWGSLENFKNLHFEACYYQAIDYAITHRLARVEAGAQGEHKLQRGYLPVPTYSAHFLADPGFHRAVDDFLRRETAQVENVIAGLESHSPFRRDNQAGSSR